jgi:hypothetical protein
MCICGKVEFATVKAARTALHSAMKSGRQRRHERSFYRCRACGGYHMTSELPVKGQRFT